MAAPEIKPDESVKRAPEELEHPELEYRPWGDPDTWIPPEAPVQ